VNRGMFHEMPPRGLCSNVLCPGKLASYSHFVKLFM
jgi:hypothetical protein